MSASDSIADIHSGLKLLSMTLRLPGSKIVVAALSVAASIVLGALPYTSPTTSFGPLAFLNWVLFMTVSQLIFRPFGRLRSSAISGPHDHKIFWIVFVSFAVAGWSNILNQATLR